MSGRRLVAERHGRRGETLAAWYLRLNRLRRVAAAAESLAARYSRIGEDVRIDLLLLAPGRWPRHIVNAWQP